MGEIRGRRNRLQGVSAALLREGQRRPRPETPEPGGGPIFGARLPGRKDRPADQAAGRGERGPILPQSQLCRFPRHGPERQSLARPQSRGICRADQRGIRAPEDEVRPGARCARNRP